MFLVIDRRKIDGREAMFLVMIDHPLQCAGQRRPAIRDRAMDNVSVAEKIAWLGDLLEQRGSAKLMELLEELQAINDELKVPTPAQFGIERQAFFDLMPTMAEQTLASGSPNNNPRVPTAEQVVEIYKQLW